MRKTCILALFLAVPGAAWAQQAAAPAAKAEIRAPHIAVVDLGRLSTETILGKGFNSQLDALKNEIDAEGTKKQTELAKMDAALKTLQDELEKQASVLSPDAADKKRKEIVQKTRDRQAYLEDGQQDLQKMRERAQQQAQNLENEFQVKIKPYIEAVVKEKGIDILLDSRVAQYAGKEFDISRDVIVKADDAERAKGPGASAAKAPEKPAEKPAPPKP
jgi:Skp family chaperone for outer membrane proteins